MKDLISEPIGMSEMAINESLEFFQCEILSLQTPTRVPELCVALKKVNYKA